MKKLLTLGIAIMITFAVSAQKNVTKFMGIPVDGTKAEMIQKLKAKGFTYNSMLDVLTGQFNGKDVDLRVFTNHDKVWLIAVIYPFEDLVTLKTHFNALCRQFDAHKNYTDYDFVNEMIRYGRFYLKSKQIGDNEDIAYQMSINNKKYIARYYQTTKVDWDTIGISKWKLKNNLTDKDPEIAKLKFLYSKISHKVVFFCIETHIAGDFLMIRYCNNLNAPNGEDL